MFKKKLNKYNSNFSEYKKEKSDLAYYNLPNDVVFCKTCLMSNQKPVQTIEHTSQVSDQKTTLQFIDGVCHACRFKQVKQDEIDWKEREFDFRKLLDKYRSRNGSFDIVVPGSGGKDSFKVAHELKYNYNMNPITCTFAPNIYTEVGYNNLINWINAGFSNYNYTLNGKVHRFITRLAIDNLLHPFQPWIMGQKAFPNKFASMLKIPLVIYGENPMEYDQGRKNYKYNEDVILELHSRKPDDQLFIGGVNYSELKDNLGLHKAELDAYIPLSIDELKNNNIKCITYSYYHKWHPQGNYYYTRDNSEKFKLSNERTPGTYQKHASLDDKLDDLHYYTAYIKFGVGRAHYDASQEIRSGDITIDEGRELIKKFSGEYPKRFMSDFSEWLSIDPRTFPESSKYIEEPFFSEEYFSKLCNTFRSPHIWKLNDKNEFIMRKFV